MPTLIMKIEAWWLVVFLYLAFLNVIFIRNEDFTAFNIRIFMYDADISSEIEILFFCYFIRSS